MRSFTNQIITKHHLIAWYFADHNIDRAYFFANVSMRDQIDYHWLYYDVYATIQTAYPYSIMCSHNAVDIKYTKLRNAGFCTIIGILLFYISCKCIITDRITVIHCKSVKSFLY